MPVNYNETDGEVEKVLPSRFAFLPKMGEQETFDIVEVSKMVNPKFNIKVDQEQEFEGSVAIIKKDLGFYLACKLKADANGNEKTLVVNSFAGYRLFRDNGITDGDKIVISHPGRGDWKISRIKAEK